MRRAQYVLAAVLIFAGLSLPATAAAEGDSGDESAAEQSDSADSEADSEENSESEADEQLDEESAAASDDDSESDETDEGGEDEGSDKNWKIKGEIGTRVGQGTFVSLENDSGVPGERKPVGSAYDRVSTVYTLYPTYKWNEFTFGVEFQLVQWLTNAGGMFGIPAIGGANDPGDVYFQDIALTASWSGHTFEAIDLTLAPSLTVNLPTHPYSRNNNKYFDASAGLSVRRRFFERMTLVGSVTVGKYFHRYKTAAVNTDRVGEDNVLYRPGGAEDLGNGLVAIGGYNTSALLSTGLAAQIEITDKLSGKVVYNLINFYAYPGPDKDEFSSENSQPKKNVSQVVSTDVKLSYQIKDWLSVTGGTGTYMSPKTSDNKSLRFPFWNTAGAASNASWLELGVFAEY